jgi:hypothetical protein
MRSTKFSVYGARLTRNSGTMSERESERGPAEGGAVIEEPASTPAIEPASPPDKSPRRSARAALWMAGLLILVLAGVALSPFWAPQIEPRLPWGENRDEYSALAARVAAVEARPVEASKGGDAVQSAISALAHRVDQLDSRLAATEKRPAPPIPDTDAINSALSVLGRRVDQLEGAGKPDLGPIRSGVQQLEQRLAAIETQSASRMVSETAASKDMQQEVSRLGKVEGDLADRVAALEREAQSQNKAEIRADGMLALLLGQMREAIEQARPFPAEFDAFIRLARGSDLAAIAEPLAEPARNGVASRAVLVKGLTELAGRMATASEPAVNSDWREQTLARLRSLVTIRRIDGSSHAGSAGGAAGAVAAAQAALARGDLAGAVAALEPLTGADAEGARPWLLMARERLAAETALDHVQELLTERLGSPPAAPGAAPAKVPDEPEKARTRS